MGCFSGRSFDIFLYAQIDIKLQVRRDIFEKKMKKKKLLMSEYVSQASKNWPEASKKLNVFLLCIERIQRQLHKMDQDIIEPLELRASDFDVLSILRMQGKPYELKPSEINQMLLFSTGGTTKMLSRLENKKLIKRRANSGDARSYSVRLTKKGIELIEATTDYILDKENEFVSVLSTQERKLLDSILLKLLNHIES